MMKTTFVTVFCLMVNQLDVLISQIYFGRKLYMFRIVPLSIVRSFSLYTQQWYRSYRFVDNLQAGSECSILTRDTYHCCVYSEKLLMMDR